MKKLSLISILILFTLSFFYWNCKKEELLIAARLDLYSGDKQSGEAGKALAEPIVVRVTDQNGSPYKGASVIFQVTEGSVSLHEATTDADGKTSVVWILGPSEGEQTLVITSYNSIGNGLANSPLNVTATAGLVATSIELVSGSGQTGVAGTKLPEPVVVMVKDQNGNAFQGQKISFTVNEGSVLCDTTTTDASGRVSVKWTLGASKGEQTLTATALKPDGETDLSGSPLTVHVNSVFGKPSVETSNITEISYFSASGGGNVISNGGTEIIARGLCWSTNENPTIDDNITTDGTGTGSFTSSLTGLTDNTTYYVRAYATNSQGTAYGEEKTCTTLAFGSVSDYDGNTYKTVVIGNQTWMAENLKVTHYVNGTAIPLVTDSTEWVNLGSNNTDKAYCYYNNNANGEKYTYGALYTWAAAMNGANSSSANPSGIQGVCPTGWHLPSDTEWTELTNYLIDNGFGHGGSGSDIGKAMAATSSWYSSGNIGDVGNDLATNNSSGFVALPGGRRNDSDGAFNYLGRFAFFWSATEASGTTVWRHNLYYLGSGVYRIDDDKSNGFSVRCLRDN